MYRLVAKAAVLTLAMASLPFFLGCAMEHLEDGIDSETYIEHQTINIAVATPRGGSNFNWYTISGCNREPYGVIANYHLARAQIDNALDAVRASGQDRLRIGIFHGRGLNTGTVMDSSGGNLSSQNRKNLTDLLATIKAKGFSEVMIAFHPQGPNVPLTWPSWNEDLYQENWNLIYNLRPIIKNSGLLYRIDLMNEGTPTSSQSMLLQYAQRLWADYTYRMRIEDGASNNPYGKNDTLGFSIIGSSLDRIGRVPAIYNGNVPHLFSLHFYGDSSKSEYQQFVDAHNAMNSRGLGPQGWIIGEAFYQDTQAAQHFRNAINQTGRTVHYLTQWPLTRDRSCEHANKAPPSEYSAYIQQNF
jgi:hypothetical protein